MGVNEKVGPLLGPPPDPASPGQLLQLWVDFQNQHDRPLRRTHLVDLDGAGEASASIKEAHPAGLGGTLVLPREGPTLPRLSPLPPEAKPGLARGESRFHSFPILNCLPPSCIHTLCHVIL